MDTFHDSGTKRKARKAIFLQLQEQVCTFVLLATVCGVPNSNKIIEIYILNDSAC